MAAKRSDHGWQPPGGAEGSAEVAPLGVSGGVGLVKEGMHRVINGERGTAREARLPNPGITMAGKTGTSQVRRISRSERLTGVRKNEDKPWEERDHACSSPSHRIATALCVAVVVEHGGSGSQSAAPIARDIMAKALELDPGAHAFDDQPRAARAPQPWARPERWRSRASSRPSCPCSRSCGC